MESKENVILELMRDENYIPMKAKEIALILNVPKNEYEDFRLILNKLLEDNKIEVNRKSKYKIVDENKYITGIFRANTKGFGFVKKENSDEEIFISDKNNKNALNGDKVFVEILENVNEELHREGKIVKIIKHEKDTVVRPLHHSPVAALFIAQHRDADCGQHLSGGGRVFHFQLCE